MFSDNGSRMRWLLGIVVLLFIFFILWKTEVLFEQKSIDDPASSISNFWEKNQGLLVYLEAISSIRKNDSYLSASIERQQLIFETISAYLEKIDPYAAFLTRDEYLRWKENLSDDYRGIGMEIRKNKLGQVLCFPYPDSPADKSGIVAGDRLISVNGEPIRGKSVIAIGAMMADSNEAIVNLRVLTQYKGEYQFQIQRSAVEYVSVSKTQMDNIPIISIHGFTSDTTIKLEGLLSGLEPKFPVVIDLRGNSGGNLYSAIDSAMFFLNKDKKILTIETRQGTKQYTSFNGAKNISPRLFLWQDSGTASAAEVFIAALTENDRAVSIGIKSFGKGTKQSVLRLNDGSALILTTGYLQTPTGMRFDGLGLEPDYLLKINNPKTKNYLNKVKEILNNNH